MQHEVPPSRPMLIYHNRFIPYRNVVCFVVEGAGIFLSVLGAYLFLYWQSGPEAVRGSDVVSWGIVIALVTQFIMYTLDLYDLNIAFSPYDITFSVIFTTGIVFIAIGVFTIMAPGLGLNGNIYYLTGLFLFTFLIIWRFLLETYITVYSSLENVLVLGDGKLAFEIASLVENSRRLGFNLKGILNKGSIAVSTDGAPATAGHWDLSDIKNLISRYRVDNIVVALEDRRNNIPVRELLALKVKGVRVVEWPEFYEKLAGKIPIRNLPPSYFVFSDGFHVSAFSRGLNAVFNASVAVAALAVLLPLFAVVAILIKCDSRGPVFYFQERVGGDNRTFQLVKFRTMVEDAEKDTGAVWARDNDPRVTRVGRILRKYRIDEIPQFLNVLKGHMAVVGPRPERPEFVRILEAELPYYSLRHAIKPGVTGWAQVKFSYGGTIDESREKLEYDLFYLKNKSFKFDMYIIFKTLKILLQGRGAR